MSRIRINHQEYDIEGILFDKDGTLLDFGSLWLNWTEQLVDSIAYKTDNICQKQTFANSLGFSYKSSTWDPGGPLAIGSMQDILTILSLNLYQHNIPWNQAFQTVNEVYSELESGLEDKLSLKPIKGLHTFLQKASEQSVKMGVVTSDNHQTAKNHLETLGIDHYFASVIGRDLVKYGKPFPEMAHMALNQLSLNPEKTLIIGDSNGDMLLGKYCKTLASIGIGNKDQTHLINADHVIEDYTPEFICMDE